MAVKTRAYLKTRFESGDEPTAQDFIDLFDSYFHQQDTLPGGGTPGGTSGTFASQAEAQQGVNQTNYMNPFLTKIAIDTLVRLANIPGLATEVNSAIANAVTAIRGGVSASHNTLQTLKAFLVGEIALKEPAFTKNTAFNKYFGEAYGEVCRGNRTILQGTFRIQNHTTVSMANTWRGSIARTSFMSVQHVAGSYFKYRINHNYGQFNYLVFMQSSLANHLVHITVLTKSSNYLEFEIMVTDKSFRGTSPTGLIDIDFQLLEMNQFN